MRITHFNQEVKTMKNIQILDLTATENSNSVKSQVLFLSDQELKNTFGGMTCTGGGGIMTCTSD
jgi:hypothetical protein